MKKLQKYSLYFMLMALLLAVLAAGCGTAEKSQATAVMTEQVSTGLTVKMLDIGQGDSLLIKTADQVVLIDTGDVETRDQLVKLLKKEKITTIDKLLITHPHADHLGGAYAVLKNFTVKKVYDNGQPTNTSTYRTYMKLLQEQKIAYQQLLAGTALDFGGNVQFKVLSPTMADVQKGDDINNHSIVGKLIYGDFSLLFTGDSESEMEKVMLKKYGEELKSTVLKSPHHGSKTSSNRNYLKAVAPEVVLISLGLNNDYKHPHQVTLNKYKDLQCKIYRTDQEGTITVTSDGKTYNIAKEK